MMYGRPNHTLITTMERAEGADEGPERSQARTKQRKPSQKVILVYLQHERLSTEVSRDKSRDMAGEVGRDPLLHRTSLNSLGLLVKAIWARKGVTIPTRADDNRFISY